ncbi:MAG: FkbM family methyltransferase, partial [Candidatus Bathyarchaeia archaeon]
MFQAAAGPYLGKAKLFVSDYHGRHSLLNLHENASKYLTIDMITLDSMLRDEDNMDIIKIDVEGAEPLVLKGANETLRKTDIVIVEASAPSSFYHVSKILGMYSFKPT